MPALTLDKVLACGEMTRTVAHGERYLMTRLLLADGRLMQQLNPGLPDPENDWRKVGRFDDLVAELAQLRRAGWAIRWR